MKDLVMFFLLATVVVVIVGAVAIPAIYQPTSDSAASYTNSTALSTLTNDPTAKFYKMALTAPDTAQTVNVTLAFQLTNKDNLSLLSSTGTILKDVTYGTTSPTTFLISGSNLAANTVFNFTTNATSTGTNVTSMKVAYYSLPVSTQQGWNSAVITIWNVILALVIVVAALLFIATKLG